MNYTDNLHLAMPSAADKARPDEFNGNAEILDAAVGGHIKNTVTSENGSHGLRYYNGKLQTKNEHDEWADVSVGTKIVPTPTVSIGEYTYNASAQGPTVTGYDSSTMVKAGDSATDAGDYTLVIALKDPSNMVWGDMTTGNKEYSWSIGKADGQLSVSAASVNLNKDNLSATIVASGYTGALSASVVDTSLASVSINGSTITVTAAGASGETTINVVSGESTNYKKKVVSISLKCSFTKIYGVEWDGSASTKWSRTDSSELFPDPSPAVNNGSGSSPFDDLMPWSGMHRVSDDVCGELVSIPKYYYKWTKNGNSMKLQIADGPAEGFLVSPAHADRGDGHGERDVVYVGRYHCVSGYKSTNASPTANITRSAARSGIHNLGSDVWQYDFAMYWTICMLYLVEFADWNTQKTIGYGCGNDSSVQAQGRTDAMQYHTGTSAASRTTYDAGIQYRYIEGLWSNVYDWCDGIYFNSANVYAIKNPSNFSDTSGGTLVGSRPTTSGYTSAWNVPNASGLEYALYPNAVNGTDSTYICDYCGYDSSGVVLFVGGHYSQSTNHGLFYLNGYYTASYAYTGIGCRLVKLPS